jgi:hypothetical protein
VVPLVAFYVLGRFRVALLMAVLPFAALTIVRIADMWRERRWRAAAGVAAAVALTWLWTGRPLAADQRLIRTSDWILAWSVKYESQVYGALDAKDPSRAAAAYSEFFSRFEPSDTEIAMTGDKGLAMELADMHAECSQILAAAGQPTAAALEAQRAQRLARLANGMG